jgi:hypothetical protein|tara:strand:- start:219 stop:914 length:696 start_codon:yes stop_codon:yes gene_type:complete
MTTEIELSTTTSALVRASGSTNDLIEAMAEYQELCVALLDDNDWQTIQKKRFPKRSAWRKLAVAYGVSFEIIDRTLFWDDEGALKAAEFIVRATAPNGRHADGWGACDVSERNAGRKATHDIPATAETRAKNRAAADLFGMGEVSAEEIDRNAMYISPDEQSKLVERIDSLQHEQKIDLRHLWKEQRLPRREFLSSDQLEHVYVLIEEVEENLETDSPVIMESEVDQEESF